MAGKKGKSGKNPSSLKNLTNIADNTTLSEKIENGRKGGVASGKARREKRDMRKRILDIFDMTLKEGPRGDFDTIEGAKGQNLSVMDALILGQFKRAIGGDTRAFEFLRDTAGLKPVDKQEITTDVKESSVLSDILKAINEN